jgi:hypothetical protein
MPNQEDREEAVNPMLDNKPKIDIIESKSESPQVMPEIKTRSSQRCNKGIPPQRYGMGTLPASL